MPLTSEGWRAFAVSSISGWDPGGIGSARPYPTLFVLGPMLSAIGLLIGSAVAVGCFLAAIAATTILSGARLGNLLGGGRWFGLALGIVLLFNPWFYEKLVAGHLTMMLSTAMCLLLASELLAEKPRGWLVILCAYIAAFQIQFGLLIVLLSVCVRPDRRTIALTAAGSILSLLPSIIGLALSRSSLAGIPYTVSWQYANSVPPSDAFLLDGYSQHYTAGVSWVLEDAVSALLGCALLGAWLGFRDRRLRLQTCLIVTCAALLLSYATGLRGIFAPLYSISLGLRPTLVFRELYDLLGIVVVTYGVLAAIAAGSNRVARAVVAFSALGMISAWFISPPAHWWVASAMVPRLQVPTDIPNIRFALLPWRQPLEFNAKGSGTDPDSFSRSNNVTPLNQYDDVFPSNAALTEYERLDDPRDLEALSVDRLFNRPYLSTNIALIRRAIPIVQTTRSHGVLLNLRPLPELSIVKLPRDSDTIAPIRDLYLFDGGNPKEIARNTEPVEAPLSSSDPRVAWIDAPIIYSQYPEISNALGGAFTLSDSALLKVPPNANRRALVFVRGRLVSGFRVIAGTTSKWRWVELNGARALSCRGECAVAAWEKSRYHIERRRSPAASSVPVAFIAVTPFILIGTAPAQSRAAGESMLLYRVRFDPAWRLFGLPSLAHLQASMIFNAFVFADPRRGGRFVLVETTACLQALAMLCSTILLVLALVRFRGLPQK